MTKMMLKFNDKITFDYSVKSLDEYQKQKKLNKKKSIVRSSSKLEN